ncbi:PucR family transcriptional regulator [Litchfieldia salsa]|uniref:PucR C-terminal helix-turn-helix domain-containing protein n=1 Tax=Litchfieldia salsa TaxID=930152 RepID=A0A1H0UXB0_9BACI|nr:helix-turn-helix domain-containing protein [Litchfieldia salsa]SDP70770.1 PucR C-terminal helix-turn-helix domain-containing protein [Litchfieldia salsa]
MLEKLKNHYKDAFVLGYTVDLKNLYQWYVSDEGITFGLDIKKISERERSLLSTLFTPIEQRTIQMNEEQKSWFNFLFGSQDSVIINKNYQTCRFIHFQTNKPITEPTDFSEALQAMFPYTINILWENDRHGIVIDTHFDQKEDFQVNFEEISDTITTDFYITIRFFIGQVYPFHKGLKEDFLWEKTCFNKSLQFLSKRTTFRLHEVLPYIILEELNPLLKQKLTDSVLQELHSDKELLDTVKVFLESNLNVSLAAKKLYMHRNSLQYRIDKFIEKTGIDIKHFQGAITTYLAIINQEQFLDS